MENVNYRPNWVHIKSTKKKILTEVKCEIIVVIVDLIVDLPLRGFLNESCRLKMMASTKY